MILLSKDTLTGKVTNLPSYHCKIATACDPNIISDAITQFGEHRELPEAPEASNPSKSKDIPATPRNPEHPKIQSHILPLTLQDPTSVQKWTYDSPIPPTGKVILE
ncbi:MAG: hypothetical protein MMC33_010154 [Icmadophila ericetorum]|nr:hypothetical protein [Icmadophila ericetorum]